MISRPPTLYHAHSGGLYSFPLLPQDQMQSDTVAHQTGMNRSSSQQLQLYALHYSFVILHTFFPASLCVVLSSVGVERASSSH